LVDVSNIDMRTRVLGCDIDWSVMLAPTGMTRMFHLGGELAAVATAHKFGTLYSASTFSTVDLETIATATQGLKMFQIYVLTDHGLKSCSTK